MYGLRDFDSTGSWLWSIPNPLGLFVGLYILEGVVC